MDISALCPSLFKFCRFLQIICEVNKYNKIIVNIRKPQQSYIYIYIKKWYEAQRDKILWYH